MAEKVKLRDYQQSILDRLENVKNTSVEQTVSYLGVVIGSRHVLVKLQDITETLPIVDIQSIPLVKSWFLGVSNVRGVLYAVNDLAQMLEEVPTSISSSTRLLLLNEKLVPNVAFLADRLVGLRSLELMNKQEVAEPDNVCLGAQTFEDQDKRIWHVLDCNKLIHSKEFETPYIS